MEDCSAFQSITLAEYFTYCPLSAAQQGLIMSTCSKCVHEHAAA